MMVPHSNLVETTMSRKLDEAFAAASRLPEKDQEQLAEWLLAELSSEDLWTRLFSESPGLLGDLADEALAEHRSGRTRPRDPDQM